MDRKKIATCILCLPALILLWLPPALANAGPPPTIDLILQGRIPDDLTIVAVLADGSELEGRASYTAWERRDTFYKPYDVQTPIVALRVRAGGETYDLDVTQFLGYSNLLTLDLNTRVITQGENPLRAALLIGIRLLLTLLIEGALFWLVGYKQKCSYIVFLVINLITQGILNAMVHFVHTPLGYEIFILWLGEVVVFIAEMIAFPLLLRERGKGRAVLYAFLANVASLILGMILLTNLPVL